MCFRHKNPTIYDFRYSTIRVREGNSKFVVLSCQPNGLNSKVISVIAGNCKFYKPRFLTKFTDTAISLYRPSRVSAVICLWDQLYTRWNEIRINVNFILYFFMKPRNKTKIVENNRAIKVGLAFKLNQ